MAVQTQTGTQIVSNFASAVQGAAKALIDFSTGAILRAIGQGAMGIALWLQATALQIAGLTRFATSFGADADSFGADFGFTRLPPKPASGQVTFARFTPTQQATIQAATSSGTDSFGNTIWTGGEIVQTPDASEQFMVIPDTTQGAYNSGSNSYVIPASTASITATVVATSAGSAGNVAAGTLTSIGSAIPGVDTVTNALAFTNGADAESDTAYKARFPAYQASLAKATPAAVKTAVTNVQQDATCALTENLDYAGSPEDGYFYVVADDGSGDPPSGFLSAAANAIEATRPVGTTYAVFAPVVIDAAIVLTVTAASGYTHSEVAPLVQSALEEYVDALPLGATLYFTRITQVAYDASPGVLDVTAVTVNSGTSDIVPTAQQVVKCTSCLVN